MTFIAAALMWMYFIACGVLLCAGVWMLVMTLWDALRDALRRKDVPVAVAWREPQELTSADRVWVSKMLQADVAGWREWAARQEEWQERQEARNGVLQVGPGKFVAVDSAPDGCVWHGWVATPSGVACRDCGAVESLHG